MEFLKDVLGEELYKQVEEKLKGSTIKLADLSQGGYISKEKFDNRESADKAKLTSLEEQLASREADIAKFTKKLEEAKGSAEKYSTLQAEMDALKNSYETEKKTLGETLTKQKYEFMVKEKIRDADLKFTSKSAKDAFTKAILEKGLPVENDVVLGFDSYIDEWKKSDPEAFKVETTDTEASEEEDQNPPPVFITPTKPDEASGEPKNPFNFNFTGVRKKD